MGLPRRLELRLDPDVQLLRAHLEPRAATRSERLGLRQLAQSEQLAEETPGLRLAAGGRRDLNVVEPFDHRRESATRRYGERGMSGIPVTGVSELVLEVVDLAAAERFYAEVLGLPVVERWEDREAVWVMAGDRTRIGLWRPQVGLAGGRGGIHVHYAMHIPAEGFDAAVERLRQLGNELELHEFGGYDDSRAVYVTDPDGNVVELWTWDVARHLEKKP
jgi:catechol-2,3-dioxygenase